MSEVGYVQYDAEDLVECIRKRSEQALQEKRITLAESQRLLQTYEQSLSRYTYFLFEKQCQVAKGKGEGRGWRKNSPTSSPPLSSLSFSASPVPNSL